MIIGTIVEHKLDPTYVGKVTGVFDDVIQVKWRQITEEQSCMVDELFVVEPSGNRKEVTK